MAEVIETERAGIENGNPSDYPKYREAVGFLRGINATLAMLDELEKGDD